MQYKQYKKLTRSRINRQWAGVCGGLADYMNIDVTLIRLAFVLGTIFTAVIPVVVVYLVMMFIVPEDY